MIPGKLDIMRHSTYAAPPAGRHRQAAPAAVWSATARLIAFLVFLVVSFWVLLAVSLIPASPSGRVLPGSSFVPPATYGAPGPTGGAQHA